MPIYTSNPSVPSADEIRQPKRTRLGNELKGLVVDNGSGEVLGHDGAMVYEWEEVDEERFVKLYLAGLKQAAGRSKLDSRCSSWCIANFRTSLDRIL